MRLPWIVSVALHALVLFAGALLLREAPVYAVAAGKASVEVDLIAAAPDTAPRAEAPPPPVEPLPDPTPDPDPDTVVPPPSPAPPVPEPPRPPAPRPPPKPVPLVPVPLTPEKGDGSSPHPGKSATTLHSDAGALPTVQPDYLSNPAPSYPPEARRQHQEGLVVVDAVVGTDGRVESVSLERSSNSAELDASALAAVRGWRFRPATALGVKIRSQVRIPVRFRLDG